MVKHKWVLGAFSAFVLFAASFSVASEAVPPSQPSEFSCKHGLLADFESDSEQARFLKDAADALKSQTALPGDQDIRNALPLAGFEAMDPAQLLFLYLQRDQKKAIEMGRLAVLKAFRNACKRLGRMVSMEELAAELHITPEYLTRLLGEDRLFADRAGIKKAALLRFPEAFKKVVDTDFFDEGRLTTMVEAIRNRTRIILVSAVAGAPVHREFFAALLNYAKVNDAEILVYPQNVQTFGLDPILLETPGVHIVTNHVEVTKWIRINRIRLLAKQVDPITGLKRYGGRGVTQIVGHPKMRLETVPTADNMYFSHKILTTGALTHQNYAGELYVQQRTDELADDKHMFGAVVLEKMAGRDTLTGFDIKGNYHIRHIEYIESAQGFSDLGQFYTAAAATPEQPEAVVLGDIHVGATDQVLLSSLREQIFSLRPKYVVLHDILDGRSISHHEAKNLLSLAQKAQRGDLDLEAELREVVSFLNALLDVNTSHKIIVVPSNHDLWLQRWLKEGRFMQDPRNAVLGNELAGVFLRGEDPLAYALVKFGLANPKRVISLKVGELYATETAPFKVQLGLHGHAGANGARAGINSVEEACDRAVFGHTHTYRRKNGIVNVGTFTRLVLGYNAEGFSNWNHSLAIVDSHGGIQALEYQAGQWYKPFGVNPVPASEYFESGYPRAIPNRATTAIGQIDQYSGY